MTPVARGGAAVAALCLLAASWACKEPTTGPTGTGTIQGRVLHAETNQPIGGASVTTSPATSAPVTANDGRFTLADIDAGEYAVSADKAGFEAKSVSVRVRADDTTEVSILLRPELTADAALDAEITNWWNSSRQGDSVFAEVEYRVQNVSRDSTPSYELYFEIHTPNGIFTHEAEGETLQPSESDIGSFEEFIRDAEADSVVIAEVFFQGVDG